MLRLYEEEAGIARCETRIVSTIIRLCCSRSTWGPEYAGSPERRTEVSHHPFMAQTRWRKRRDSNPRYPFGYASFQDWSHQPLGHSS